MVRSRCLNSTLGKPCPGDANSSSLSESRQPEQLRAEERDVIIAEISQKMIDYQITLAGARQL